MAVARLASVVLAMIGGAATISPASAATHHRAHESSRSHTAASHHTTKATAKRSSKHASTNTGSRKHASPKHEAASAPHGVTSVPSGGLKVYCGPGKDPLLIRKMTQGSGTTVTVICH